MVTPKEVSSASRYLGDISSRDFDSVKTMVALCTSKTRSSSSDNCNLSYGGARFDLSHNVTAEDARRVPRDAQSFAKGSSPAIGADLLYKMEDRDDYAGRQLS